MKTRHTHGVCGLLATLLFCSVASSPAAADPDVTTSPAPQQVMLIKSPPEILTRQKLPNFVGISAETAGARGLSMNLVIIPPGASAEPHFHKGFESAVYVLEGRVETRYESVITEAGDFLFIPPDVPHQPVNLSETEAARAIVVRNDPNEQEHVILYDPNGDD
jgi:uncharacterized RmlC-like cupin family protein